MSLKLAAFEILLARRTSLPARELAQHLFRCHHLSPSLSETLIATLFCQDERFVCDNGGRWRLAPACLQSSLFHDFIELAPFCVVDVETTGGKPPGDKITELAAVRVQGGKIVGEFCALVNPGRPIPPFVARLTGINDGMVAKMPSIEEVLESFLSFLGESIFVAHHASFDRHFINAALEEVGRPPMANAELCSARLGRRFLPHVRSSSLDSLAAYFGIEIPYRHRAFGDARATGELLLRYLEMAADFGIHSLSALLAFQRQGRKQPKARRKRKKKQAASS